MSANSPQIRPFRAHSAVASLTFNRWAALLLLLLGSLTQAQTQTADGNGAYRTGRYRNLFVEQGHKPAEVRARIDQTFAQLFHGDPHTQAVYYEAGENANGPLANLATGLSADYEDYDGTPHATGFNPMSADFAEDSWRTASNWSVDYAWWRKSPEEPKLSDRIQSFFYAQGIHTFPDRYTPDGKPASKRHSTGLVATTATASLAATSGPTSRAFVEELWNTPIPSGEQRYFDGLLYMMSLLHASGEFRIWGPR